VATLVAKNANQALGGGGGVWRRGESGGGFCVGACGTVNMFSLLMLFIKKFYKCFTFNTICKDNGAINCITVQIKKFHSRQL
jgi:hypothetical protein